MNTLIALLVVVALGLGGYFLWNSPQAADMDADMNGNMGMEGMEGKDGMQNTTGMRAEDNMVVVMEQRPGTTVTGMVHLAAPGYLVIHEDKGGEPGAVLGASALLPAGDTDNIKVALSRPSKDGETLHAMLHFEKGGNTAFSAAEDTPVPSALGGPIHGWFQVSSDAAVDVPISI